MLAYTLNDEFWRVDYDLHRNVYTFLQIRHRLHRTRALDDQRSLFGILLTAWPYTHPKFAAATISFSRSTSYARRGRLPPLHASRGGGLRAAVPRAVARLRSEQPPAPDSRRTAAVFSRVAAVVSIFWKRLI